MQCKPGVSFLGITIDDIAPNLPVRSLLQSSNNIKIVNPADAVSATTNRSSFEVEYVRMQIARK